ncbi:unnamed protein product (macronuclear) [Paramecium tetraurelia]|uniref:Transmembrane protein n=1 Tax=Paramecium tetraurelia TaxID=5888 RepID=A0CDJ3_PARTE|nr:uncharacterized protein GSPATT00007071001 [Paramecium tetraurelia]CAK68860.1 unnamed protein product [Paramecium tetraurelia]|eukprot:XP_001436257.1 hypothetical protein (macronuclear) [Paramecium tetraurelia strain d4-2]
MKYFEYFRALIIIIVSFCSLAQNVKQTLQLLDEYDPYQKLVTQVQNTRTGYGIWFKFIAFKRIFSTHLLTEGLDSNEEVKGYIICLSQGDQFEILLYFMEDFNNNLINLKFIINTNQEQLINYKYYDFEGIWIYAAVALDPIQSSIEVYLYNEQAFNNFIYNKFQLTTQIPQVVNSFLGGYGRVQNMNLLPFTAKQSEFQIIEVFDQIGSNFQQFNQKIIEGGIFERIKPQEQRILLVDDQYFNGNNYLKKIIFLEGSSFLLQGWVKLSEQVEDYGFILASISYSQLQYSNVYPGDEILSLQYQISTSGQLSTQFTINTQLNQNPNIYKPYFYCGYEAGIYGGQPQVYHQLISWHYLQFQLGNKDYTSSIHLYFSYDQTFVGGNFQPNFQPYQFSNVNASIQIAGINKYRTFMNGQMAKLEFIHSYQGLKPFILNCHPTCFGCVGPYENQCLSCNPIYNRVFLPFKNLCACGIGYIESLDSLDCISIVQNYQTAVIFLQKENENDAIKCQLGYFEFMNSCYPCPFGKLQLNCLDCINNQKEWFKNPMCNWDFNQIYFSFRQAQREQEFLDLYLINQPFSMQLCDGCAGFCTPIESECNKLIGAQHLGQYVFVKCKSNFKFINGACKLNPPFCSQQNEQGICIECLSQYYFDLDQQNCVECPQDCQRCRYDETINKVQCDSCLDESSVIVNGGCSRCGLNCKTCQIDFNLKKKEYFLRCLECIDMNKYYIMFNAIDCLEIKIDYCLYGYQYLETDHSITTMDIFFEPQDFDENVRVGCARCMDDYFTYSLITNQCVYTFYQYQMCKQSVFDYSGTYICLIIYNQVLINQKIYEQFLYCPLIDKCILCLKINDINQVCLECNFGYYASYTGVCIKCPTELNCFRCTQNLKQYNDNFRKDLRAFYKFFVEESNQNHFYNDYNQKFQKEQYMVQCTQCLENYELYNGKCIKSCPQYCESCIKINDENVCQSCPFTYLGKILSVVDDNCLECPTYCQICIKRSQSEVAAINPYYTSQSQIYQNICIKGFSYLYFYDEDLQSFQDCSSNPHQQKCFKSITIDVKIYCQDDFVSYKNQINIKDLFSSNSEIDHLSYFENEKLYSYANKNTVKELIYNFEIVDGLEHSCKIPQEGQFQQSMSKNVFSAILIKLNFYSSQQSDLLIFENFYLLGFTEIIISNISFISSSNLIATIIIDSKFNLKTTFQNVNFGSLNKQQQIIIFARSQQSIEFRDIQIINLLLSEMNSQFILIKTNQQPSQLTLDNVKFINCDFINIILFNILNQNSIKINISNLKITNMVVKNSTYIKLSFYGLNNILMQNLDLNQLIIDSTIFFNLNYFYQIQVKQALIQDSTLINTILFSLNNFIEIEDITLSGLTLQSYSTLFQGGISYINEPQFILDKISFNLIKYEKEVPLIYVNQENQQPIQIQLLNIQIQNSQITQIELLNEIDISKNKILLSCNLIKITNFLIIREEDLPEIAILNSIEVIIDNLQIIKRKREQFLSFICLDSSKFQQEYSLISFFEVRKITIQNSIFSNNTLYNQGIIQIIYDQKMNLIQEILQKLIIINQVKFERNLLLKNLNQNSLGLISIIDQNQIVIHFSSLIFQGNLLNEFQEESQIASSLLIVAIAPRGYFSLITSSLEYNLILNSTVSLLYINTQQLNIAYTLFNNNNVMNYTTLNYFIKDLSTSITSIYTQSGNGYLKTSSLVVNDVHLNTSQGFYGGGFQISSQNISTLTIQNCQFSNLSNLIDNSLSYGAAIYLEIQSQEILMQFINISVSQVFTQNLGGFLFIKSSIYQKIQIEFQNSFFKDNYADLGSILYFDNSINSNEQPCKLSLKEIIVEQSAYQTYFENLKFDNQNQIDNTLAKQRQLINLKMCSIEFKNSYFVNLIQEGIISVEQSSEIILANLLVDNANIVNQQLINIVSYSDIQLTNIQVLNTQNNFNYKSNRQICKLSSTKINDCTSISQMTDFMKQIECSQELLIFSSQLSASTLINIVQQITTKSIFFRNITFMNNQINELININALIKQQNVSQIVMDTLFSHSNLCLNSCITIQPISYQPDEKIVSKDILISNYYCLENTALQGCCLNTYEFSITVLRSNFINNTAKYKGGAVYYEGKSIVFKQSQIYYNKAEQGGGVFTNIQLPIFIEHETFKANQASYFGNDIVEIPSKLGITVDNYRNILFPTDLMNNQSIQLDQIKIQNYSMFDGSITSYIYFPSGQQIGQYQYFDQKLNKYINANQTLRVVALNRQNDIMRNLSNFYCTIFSDDSQIQIKVKFNESSQDFDFDDQIFTFTPYTEQPLLLKIKCNCIKVLSNTITNSQNYQLQFQVKTFTCKIGEIFDRDQCKACDYTQDLYSVIIKSIKCSKRNELTTSSVTSGQLKLRQGFWRYHQNSDDILQCSYSQTKCKGGWETGDASCEIGYVGALCEQCDIYGTRGSEKFQNLFKYSCQQCSSQRYTIFYYIILNIWNILAIGITAFCIKSDFNKLFRVFWFSTISCNKIFLHYFQIIFYLTMLQLNIPIQLSSIINFLGNPTESISFSLDCVWSNYEATFNIIYIRAIIQIFSPILYLIIIGVFILFVFRTESETRHHLIFNSLQYCKLYYSPSIFSCLISLISYRVIGGKKWVLADVTYIFDSQEHYLWILQFIIPIFILFLIILVLDFVAIFQRKQQLTLLKTKMMFGYLYLNYKSKYYYWEYCKLIQKFLLVIVLLQFQDQIVWKATFVVLIIIVYQQLVEKFQPYKASLFNNLESHMHIVCLTTIIFSILVVQSEQYNLKFIEICSYVFLIAINAQFLLYLTKLVIKLNSSQAEKIIDNINSKLTSLFPILKSQKIVKCFNYKRTKKSAQIRKRFQNLARSVMELVKNKGPTTKKQEKGNRVSIRYFQQDYDTGQQLTITNTNIPQVSDNQKMLKTHTEFMQDDEGLETFTINKQIAKPRL